MKNKELAFDFISRAMFQDINAGSEDELSKQFSPEDQTEMNTILEGLRGLHQGAMNYQATQQDLARKTETINLRNIENTIETVISLKESLQDVIKDAKGAYKKVMWMYIIAFYLGIGLIVTAIVFAAYDKAILAIAFGAIGLIDLATQFIFKPPLDLQSSRSNLAQLVVALTNWFADLMNLNSYLSVKGSSITIKDLESISAKQNSTTEHMLKLIEQYCEPSRKS